MLTIEEISAEFKAQTAAAGRFAGRLQKAIDTISEGNSDLDLADAMERHAIHLERGCKPEPRYIYACIEAARLLRSGPDFHF